VPDNSNVARRIERGPRNASGATEEPRPDLRHIDIQGVRKTFPQRTGGNISVLEKIDLAIAENEFVSLVGRSGCGKTTLLNIIAGLEAATEGAVAIAGRTVTGPGQGQGVVFQQHALFPWLTARDNVAFGFRQDGLAKAERRDRAMDLLRLVGLEQAARAIPGKCRAACSSASRSPAPWRSIPRSC
jgi:ABC-type nitrate/sulfonate/bicarbonate transport system ATPase subunit